MLGKPAVKQIAENARLTVQQPQHVHRERWVPTVAQVPSRFKVHLRGPACEVGLGVLSEEAAKALGHAPLAVGHPVVILVGGPGGGMLKERILPLPPQSFDLPDVARDLEQSSLQTLAFVPAKETAERIEHYEHPPTRGMMRRK